MTVRQLKRQCGACRTDAAVDLLCIRLSHGAADIAKHKSGSADSVTGISTAWAESGGGEWNSRSSVRPSRSASIRAYQHKYRPQMYVPGPRHLVGRSRVSSISTSIRNCVGLSLHICFPSLCLFSKNSTWRRGIHMACIGEELTGYTLVLCPIESGMQRLRGWCPGVAWPPFAWVSVEK